MPEPKSRLEQLADAETVLKDDAATPEEVEAALKTIAKVNQELDDIADQRRENRFGVSL